MENPENYGTSPERRNVATFRF